MPAGCQEFAFRIGEGNREERKKERKGICGKIGKESGRKIKIKEYLKKVFENFHSGNCRISSI